MVQLSNLTTLVGKKKRVGRGGKRGGTSGRGHKGQSARSGGSVGCVKEGGQMPLVRRLPKHGFSNARFRKEVETINLDRLNILFNDGDVVNKEILMAKRLLRKGQLVKILGNGILEKKLIVHVDACSLKAQEAIEKLGGAIHLIKEM